METLRLEQKSEAHHPNDVNDMARLKVYESSVADCISVVVASDSLGTNSNQLLSTGIRLTEAQVIELRDWTTEWLTRNGE